VCLRVWKTLDGWRHDLNPKTILQGDDVAIIIGLIEENLIEGIEQKRLEGNPRLQIDLT